MRKSVSRYVMATATLLCAGVAAAQGGDELVLEEVIVTAQQRVESLQDVPVSVNAVAGEKIVEAGIEKIEDIALYVPNLAMSETGIGTNLYLRGIGSGINNGFEQSVGMYVDGIYYGRPQLTRVPFLDLERVEVLRGPQAILFGKNSIAGAISMITAKPTDEFEASISGLYEVNFNEREITGIVSGPLVEGLRGRVAFQKRDIDGYIDNLTLGRDEPQRDELFVRGTLAWDVTPDLDVSVKLEYGEFDVTGRQVEITADEPILPPGAYITPGTIAALGTFQGQTYGEVLNSFGADASVLDSRQDFNRSASGPEFSENTIKNVTVTANWALGEHTLTSISGYLNYEFNEECDCDFTGANVFTVPAQENFEQFSQELRLVSPTGQRFEYIAGAFYQENSVDFNEKFLITSDTVLDDILGATPFAGFAPFFNSFTVPRTYFQDTTSWSIFAQGTWNVTDTLSLTVGARYSEDDKEAARELSYAEEDGSPLPAPAPVNKAFALNLLIPTLFRAEEHSLAGSRDESNFSPLINIQWFYSGSGMAYFTWTRGNKSGGFDARSNVGLMPVSPSVSRGTFEFQEEDAQSFELGIKTSLLNDRAELNVALFRTEFDELQVSIFDGVLGFNVGNAAGATSQGIEIDGRFLVTEELMLNYSVAYIDFEFDEFPNGQCSFNEQPTGLVNRLTGEIEPFELPTLARAPVCDYAGRTNQYVADVQAAVSADYARPIFENLELRATLDVLYTDDYFASQNLDPQSVQDAYVKLNARIGIGSYDGKWNVALVMKNLTDEDIITYANDTPLGVGTFGARGRYSFMQSPRTFAFTGTYRF